TANNNDIVVALIDQESATVKRFFKEKDCIRLQPENDTMQPFYEKNVSILGKVIGVYRQM
ncbi:MAG: S24 family peptidase, partial [Selenomonadaceae bacterium]